VKPASIYSDYRVAQAPDPLDFHFNYVARFQRTNPGGTGGNDVTGQQRHDAGYPTHFYRDLLGLEVMSDQSQPIGTMPTLYAKPETGKRRAVNLRYGKGPGRGFLVLSERPGGTPGEAIKLDEVGISHFSWWVDDFARDP
jgi:hypothetical protein